MRLPTSSAAALLFVLCSLSFGVGCGLELLGFVSETSVATGSEDAPPSGASEPATVQPEGDASLPSQPELASLPEALNLGAWADYAEPVDDAPLRPLTLLSWATISAELACAGRSFQGDPERQRNASERILGHHGTNASEVMRYGVALNQQPEAAFRLGALVSRAAEQCH